MKNLTLMVMEQNLKILVWLTEVNSTIMIGISKKETNADCRRSMETKFITISF